MRLNWTLILAGLALAAGLRFWQLGLVPTGLTWDEAAIGYNGFAVLNTRRDEWLVKLPISFRSFGDYKAPLAIYINGVFTQLAGLTPFGIRLPFALAGVLSVGMLGLMIYELAQAMPKPMRLVLSLTALLLLATSPWHVHFSRVGFESGLALALILFGTYLWIKKQPIVAALFLALSLYTYHSAKVFTPLWLIFLSWQTFKENSEHKLSREVTIKLFVAWIIFGLILVPFVKDSWLGEGLTRAGVTIFSHSQSVGDFVRLASLSLWAHLDPRFWLLGKADNLRHSSGALGVLQLTELFLIVLSLIIGLNRHWVPNQFSNWWRRMFVWGSVWSSLGLLPALIGIEAPHPNRALLALPGLIILANLGCLWIWLQVGKWRFAVLGCLVMAHTILSVAFVHDYFGQAANQSGKAFLEGTFEAAQLSVRYIKGQTVPGVEQVIFSSANGQPYIYVLLASRLNPIAYQGGGLAQYSFPEQIKENDLTKNNALLIASPADPINQNHRTEALTTIVGRNGQVRYYVYRTPKQ